MCFWVLASHFLSMNMILITKLWTELTPGLYREALPAATRPFDVWVVEDELRGQLRGDIVHLCAEEG